jgi:hypothetical protein
MKRVFCALTFMLMLAGCYGELDPCSFDKSVPACDLSRSKAQATIGAIDADAALRATQSAIFLSGQETKAAISADATRQVVQAEATHSAMNTSATRQAIGAEATKSAIVYRSTQTYVDAEATKIAVSVSGAVERARIERDAMPASSTFNVIVFWFLIPALAVLGVIMLGRRTISATTQALHKRAAMLTYGPANNPQLAFVTFDPRSGQPVRFITAEGLVGSTADLLSGRTMLDDMAIPEPLRLAALMEASKRAQAARISAATGRAPWSVTHTVEDTPAPLVMPQPISPAAVQLPRIPTFAELLQTWTPTIDQMLFGFDEQGRPIYGSLDQLLSCLVIGRQGQGKTTLLRLIDLQCALTGVEVFAWDVHDDIAEDVPGIQSFMRSADIEKSARAIEAELDKRMSLKLKGSRARPIMILIDEVNMVVDRAPSLPGIIKRIVSEGRKYRIFEFVTAKGAPSDIFEKSWARDTFSALISFWTSALQARNVGFEPDAARLAEGLTPGRAVLRLQTMPAQVVTFPDLPLADMQRLLPASRAASAPASRAASGPLPETGRVISVEAEKAAEIDYFEGVEAAGRTETVRQLIKAGKSQREIIAEVWGATSGRAYQEAARELNNILQRLVP